MIHLPTIVRQCLVGFCTTTLCANSAWAQLGERAPLRADLQAAAGHLMHHPHPYAMTEEVARVRLQKLGFERTEALRPTAHNTFQTEVMKNGERRRVEIDRISGEVRPQQ